MGLGTPPWGVQISLALLVVPCHVVCPPPVEATGGKCLACVVDIREESQLQAAVDQAVEKFGGIDVLVNNASAINLTGTVDTPMKKYVCQPVHGMYDVLHIV